jgi:hypothetical protein
LLLDQMPQRFPEYVLAYCKKDLNAWPTLAHKSPVQTCSSSVMAKASSTGVHDFHQRLEAGSFSSATAICFVQLLYFKRRPRQHP